MKPVMILALIVFLAFCSTYFLPIEETFWSMLFWDFFFSVIAGVATVTSFITSRIYGYKSVIGKVWLFVSIGLFFWFLGETLWGYYEVFLEEYPFPSIADVAWLLGYIPFYLALHHQCSHLKTPIPYKEFFIVFLITTLYGFISGVLVIGPIVKEVEYPLIEKALTMAYPIADIFLIFCGLIAVSMFKGGRLSRSWLFISLAFLTSGIADTIFSWLEWQGLYELSSPYDYVDFLWVASYLFFILGAYYEKLSYKK